MPTRHPLIRRAVLGALALLALAVPASAAASPAVTVWTPAGGDAALLKAELEGDMAIAAQRFGPACPGGITATWNSFEVAYSDSPGARAWARSFAPECRIDFNVALWQDPTWRAAVYDPPWLCTLVVHEYGHLAGNAHTADPADVMYPLIERVYPACADARAPRAAVTPRATRPKARKARQAKKAKQRRSRRRTT